MKLIPLTILLISLAVDTKAQKFRQEQFPFPPQFQTPNSGLFSSDSTLYLPPESHTTIPYYPIKNVNNLQFPYLPPTGTKAPTSYPTPFPLMISSSFVPNFDEDDDDDEDRMKRKSTSHPAPQKMNRTEQNQNEPVKEKREMRPIPKFQNFQQQQPIDRVDVKFPDKFHNPAGFSTPAPMNQSPASRRMIITTESHGSDLHMDQMKAASFQANQYLQAPGIFISSTTEPAIPILRLSNEMDLDGSFSYEALGADQTHYVQHSRMENMGNDKEEQVVEGSYSYVGDNGQTYTVHYIADSNGFRASGDHLPVAPPIPEIIQRSIQYNLAEEAKRPPNQKSWQDEQYNNEIGDNTKNNNFVVPPPRNLFTGRQPEAFSYSYSQGSNTQNNLVAAASSQAPVKTVDYTTEQPKPKPSNGPISPQITFLASQGAHVPSMNTVQNTMARMFNTEKPSNMPQLVNYEAALKESDQESNKALWRWQYGLNANNLNQNQNKDTISRSFGEGDDVMINFGDMTPDQYTNMIRSQLEPNSENIVSNHFTQNQQMIDNQQYNINNDYSMPNVGEQQTSSPAPEPTSAQPQTDWFRQAYNSNYNNYFETTIKPVENREVMAEPSPKLITQKDFALPTHTVTQSYDYDENFYEPRKIKALNTNHVMKINSNSINDVPIAFDKNVTPSNMLPGTKLMENELKVTTTLEPSFLSTFGNLRFTDFIVHDDKSDFKPIITSTEAPRVAETTTTESVEDIFESNLFLKNLFKPDKTERKNENRINDEPKKVFQPKLEPEPKTEKTPKFIQQYQPKTLNEVKTYKKKPIDITEVLNYVSMKNQFESSKIRPKSKPIGSNNFDHRNDMRYIPVQQERNEESNINTQAEHSSNNYRTLNQEQQEELRGIIKNYKVLQRNNMHVNKHDNNSELRRDLSPPPLKSPGLPPLGRAGPSMKSYLPPIFV